MKKLLTILEIIESLPSEELAEIEKRCKILRYTRAIDDVNVDIFSNSQCSDHKSQNDNDHKQNPT